MGRPGIFPKLPNPAPGRGGGAEPGLAARLRTAVGEPRPGGELGSWSTASFRKITRDFVYTGSTTVSDARAAAATVATEAASGLSGEGGDSTRVTSRRPPGATGDTGVIAQNTEIGNAREAEAGFGVFF